MGVKQVIVVRKDLNMRKGKIAAQSCHASLKVFFDILEIKNNNDISSYTFTSKANKDGIDFIKNWITGNFKKIVVSVNSEKELDEIYLKARNSGLPCSLIVDDGLTEFNGIKTKTCVAIGPWLSEEINKITGGLQLL